MIRKYGYYVLGILILSLGIECIIYANLGAGPWDLLSIELHSRTVISIGIWQIICNVCMIILSKLVFKRKWNFICLIPGVLQGFFIDVFSSLFRFQTVDPMIFLILGCLLSGVGLSIYMNQGLSANAIDNFTHLLSIDFNFPSGVSKIISDAIPLVLVIVLGANITLYTLAIYILVPVFMNLSYKIIYKNNRKLQKAQ